MTLPEEIRPEPASTPEAQPVAPEFLTPAPLPEGVANEPTLFASFTQPPPPPEPKRIPHLGHVALLGALVLLGWICSFLLVGCALYFHLFFHRLGVTKTGDALMTPPYLLSSMAILYLASLGLSLAVFPPFWKKGLFAGLGWRGGEALRRSPILLSAFFACIVLAAFDAYLMPGPKHTPIEQLFQTPSGAWMMFVFGVTFAPFFEELAFRGFLLPALCTACDWIGEKIRHESPHALDGNGSPSWSLPAMIAGSILVSVPFSLAHGDQTAFAIGPMLLLVCVSLILCWIRLQTRSLAASTLVHAAYNFLLFALMAVATGGFQHFDKM